VVPCLPEDPLKEEKPNNANKTPSNTIRLRTTQVINFPSYLSPRPAPKEKVHRPQGLLIAITLSKFRTYKSRLAHLGLTPGFSFSSGLISKSTLVRKESIWLYSSRLG